MATCLTMGFWASPSLSGQGPRLPQVAVLELEATYPEGFAYLGGMRELADGRVYVADPTSEVLVRVDFQGLTGDTLGRVGEGPQEYRQPDRVFPFPGDSTLLVDLGNGRLIMVDPQGTFVRWIPTNRVNAQGRSRTLQPSHVDGAGTLYAYSLSGSPPGDSTYISRFELDGGEMGVAARLWHPDYRSLSAGGKRAMFIPFDGMAVGEDGRVAVLRANGYSVEWHYPDGRVTTGPGHRADLFPVTELEREAEVETMMAEAVFTATQVGGDGSRQTQLRRGVPASQRPGMGDFSWPERLPIFRPAGIVVSPRHRVWVERMVPVGQAPRLEVFDESGLRFGFVELPVGARLLGFGTGGEERVVAYLARTDSTGLKWLERYRVDYLRN